MSRALSIEADWERLESALPEERACFAAIGIQHRELWLTEAEDLFVNRVRHKVHLSAYKLAEWLAWNWWRLRWEPRRHSTDWAMAHRMTTIGAGYVWPNVTVISDGQRVVLNAQPTRPAPAEPLRYIASVAAVVRASDFEAAVDMFIGQVCGQLSEERSMGRLPGASTNLEAIWSDTLAERADPDSARSRKFEALLGFDPDEADPKAIERLVQDSIVLGEHPMAELAADDPGLGLSQLQDLAQRSGVRANPKDAVKFSAEAFPTLSVEVAAWRRGAEAAEALRRQEHLGDGPLSNKRLCQLAGVVAKVLAPSSTPSPLSFALDEFENGGHVALRAKRETGRRFDLARLIGDRLTAQPGGRLFPATRAYTYRQKLQRSFAAEFLCPSQALVVFLSGDFSGEAIDDAAAHFNLSQLAVRTLLVNHKLLDGEDLEEDLDVAHEDPKTVAA